MRELTTENVEQTLNRVLFTDAEAAAGIPEGAVVADGILHKFAFHPGRLALEKDAIAEMLSQLPKQFRVEDGGGWSFLNAAQRADGVLWGEHRAVEMLICLGVATKQANWVMKDMMNLLPGGMPYVQVNIPATVGTR